MHTHKKGTCYVAFDMNSENLNDGIFKQIFMFNKIMFPLLKIEMLRLYTKGKTVKNFYQVSCKRNIILIDKQNKKNMNCININKEQTKELYICK